MIHPTAGTVQDDPYWDPFWDQHNQTIASSTTIGQVFYLQNFNQISPPVQVHRPVQIPGKRLDKARDAIERFERALETSFKPTQGLTDRQALAKAPPPRMELARPLKHHNNAPRRPCYRGGRR